MDGQNRRGLLGNALAVAANGISRSTRERLAVGPCKSAFQRGFYSGRFRSKTIHMIPRIRAARITKSRPSNLAEGSRVFDSMFGKGLANR
jgi:hypothetical protein